MTFNSKLALAPIPEKVNRVLDIGTGTGIWAIDFGELSSLILYMPRRFPKQKT